MLIDLKNITKVYDEVTLFSGLNFHIKKSEIVVLLGPSGIGKTTLLKIISKQETYSGEIDYNADIFEVEVPFPIVFQDDGQLLPWLNVKENILLPVDTEEGLQSIVEHVGLDHALKLYPKQLSGGMKQRVAIARALMCHSEVLIMDEPFNALDMNLRFKLQDMIKDINKDYHKAIIFVTHDIDEAIYMGDRVLIINKEKATEINCGNHDRYSINHQEIKKVIASYL